MKANRVYEIIWDDTTSYTHKWATKEEMKSMLPILCRSVGYLVQEDKTKKGCIRISGMTSNNNEYSDIQVIPKGCIVEVIPLAHKRGKR